MAFPTTAVLDTFNAGANQLLTSRAGWGTTVLGGGTSFRTDATPTQAIATAAGSNKGNFWNTSWVDSECYLTLNVWDPVNNAARVCARITATGASPTYYAVSLAEVGTTDFQLVKVVAGTLTSISVNTPTAVASGDSVGISVIGTAVKGWYKPGAGAWVQVVAATDSSITATGRVGTVRSVGTVNHAFDNFGGGIPVSGTTFLKTVTGSANFSGIRPKMGTQRKLPAAVSFSGAAVSRPTGRLVTAGFAPSGALARQLSLFRTLSAVFQPGGSVSTATAYVRTLAAAALSFVGSQTRVKAVSKAISGALSFVGSQTRVAQKLLAAVFQPAGAATTIATLARTVTGAFRPVGVVKRKTNRTLGAAAQYAGLLITNSGFNHFFAVFRPTGAPVTHGLPARTLYAGLALTGDIAKITARQLAASLVASGVMHTQYLPPVAPPLPGGGGFGALMSDAFFSRYHVDGKWRGVKRVRA